MNGIAYGWIWNSSYELDYEQIHLEFIVFVCS